MRPQFKDETVSYLLTHMTYMLLAPSLVKTAMRDAAQKHERRLKAMLTAEEFEPILLMRNTVAQLVRNLVECNTPEALTQTYDYIRDLNDGKVLIAVTDNSSPGEGYSEVGKSYLIDES